MRCAWKELLSILPLWLRQEMGQKEQDNLQEIRLRINAPPELITSEGTRWLARTISRDDLSQCVNNASRYSPWNAATIAQGYITAPGGHRIGLCGEAVCRNGLMTGIRDVTSLCIRVARDFQGAAKLAANYSGSILILGAPGWGKTTLLRDLIRQLSDKGEHVAVVDERGELFPKDSDFPQGKCTDVLTGCGKAEGIEAALRTMGPSCIAVYEITAKADCESLIRAGWCGVRLLATAHAGSLWEFRSRQVYRPLAESGLFSTALVMNPDKSWIRERMDI